jgi:hypothetical protein
MIRPASKVAVVLFVVSMVAQTSRCVVAGELTECNIPPEIDTRADFSRLDDPSICLKLASMDNTPAECNACSCSLLSKLLA